MKCPFCAEEIQDAAILCRFCGAKKDGDRWVSPAAPSPETKPAGSFTLKTAGALFLLSAVFEILSITAAVPLFGAVRVGAVAVIFHLFYAAVFVAMGIGLWVPKPWGATAVFAGTAFYTLEKALYIFDRPAREAELDKLLQSYGSALGILGKGSLLQMSVTIYVVLVACWWGFAIYVYFRRAYFQSAPKITST